MFFSNYSNLEANRLIPNLIMPRNHTWNLLNTVSWTPAWGNWFSCFGIFKTWEYRTTSIYGSKQGRFFFFPGEKQPETPEITKSFKEKKLLSLSRTRKLVIRKLLGPQRKTRRNAIHQSSHRHNQLRMLNMNFQKLLSIYSMDRDTSSQMILYT